MEWLVFQFSFVYSATHTEAQRGLLIYRRRWCVLSFESWTTALSSILEFTNNDSLFNISRTQGEHNSRRTFRETLREKFNIRSFNPCLIGPLTVTRRSQLDRDTDSLLRRYGPQLTLLRDCLDRAPSHKETSLSKLSFLREAENLHLSKH